MAFDYINEAFKRLKMLDEDVFDTSVTGINALSNYIDDADEETVRVIDSKASTEEELKDSYVGKVIINCNVCHSHIFEDKQNIKIEEDGSVNVEEQCPYCGESEGFAVIGEIAPFGTEAEEHTEETVEEQPVEDTVSEEESVEEEEIVEESLRRDSDAENIPLSRATRRRMQEDFKEVSIKTDDQHLEMTSDENGKVTVVTEPINNEQSVSAETIVPVSDETTDEIVSNNAEVIEEEEPVEEEDFDFDFDEIDEEGFDELGESYLREVYDNVKSYRTTSIGANSNSIVVEGLIKFNSGAEKKTGFIFEACDANSRGQLRFKGYNKHFTESKDAYSLIGRVDNKKLFVESFKYNYTVNNEAVRGRVRRK